MYSTKTILLVALISVVSGRTYNKCSLAKKLLDLDVPLVDIPKLVCLAEKRSNFDLSFHKGSLWGIYGISETHWCDSDGKPTTSPCRTRCEDLISSVGQSTSCAMLMVRVSGYQAWVGSQHGELCSQMNIDYLSECQNFVHLYQILDRYC